MSPFLDQPAEHSRDDNAAAMGGFIKEANDENAHSVAAGRIASVDVRAHSAGMQKLVPILPHLAVIQSYFHQRTKGFQLRALT